MAKLATSDALMTWSLVVSAFCFVCCSLCCAVFCLLPSAAALVAARFCVASALLVAGSATGVGSVGTSSADAGVAMDLR